MSIDLLIFYKQSTNHPQDDSMNNLNYPKDNLVSYRLLLIKKDLSSIGIVYGL